MILGKYGHNKYVMFVCLTITVMSCPGCGGSSGEAVANPPPPPDTSYAYTKPDDIGDGWTTAAAVDAGIDVSLLEQMMNALDERFDIVDSIAIAYRGQLVLNETVRTELNQFDDYVDNTNLEMHVMFSASKSLASLAIGIAIDQGIFADVDVPFLSLFDYPSYDNWDERKNDIRLEDVLSMRLGLEWNEWDPPYSDANNQMLRFYETEVDYTKSMLDLPLVVDPGTGFAYNTPAIVSLGQAIENRAPLSLIDFGIANVFTPMSITDVEVFLTPTGLPDLGRGLFLTTRDFLKFGQLYLNGGTWNEERVVSEEWINETFIARSEFGWNEPEKFDWQIRGYGYQWWIGYFEVGDKQIDAYAARGHGEQVLLVIPELELTVAVFSHAFASREDEVNQVYEMVADFVLPALP